MNLVKEAALQSEDIRDYAEEVATVAGVGRRCEMHEVFIGEFTDEDQLRTAYKIANWRIIKGAIKLPPSMSPPDFTALVKEVVEIGTGFVSEMRTNLWEGRLTSSARRSPAGQRHCIRSVGR